MTEQDEATAVTTIVFKKRVRLQRVGRQAQRTVNNLTSPAITTIQEGE